jgi:hypothetical protein
MHTNRSPISSRILDSGHNKLEVIVAHLYWVLLQLRFELPYNISNGPHANISTISIYYVLSPSQIISHSNFFLESKHLKFDQILYNKIINNNIYDTKQV